LSQSVKFWYNGKEKKEREKTNRTSARKQKYDAGGNKREVSRGKRTKGNKQKERSQEGRNEKEKCARLILS
jgi:hypothetical protein